MNNKYTSASRFLSPILIVLILLFAVLVTFSSLKAYQKEQNFIEKYTHAQMKTLILDLESKLMSIEAGLTFESHRSHVALEDSTTLFKGLEHFVEDERFVRHAGVDIWSEGKAGQSWLLYVTQLPEGGFRRETLNSSVSEVPEEELDCFYRAYDSGQPAWSKPYLDTVVTNACVVTCYTRAEQHSAMFCADVEMNSLLANLDSMQFYKSSRMYIDIPDGDIYTLSDGKLLQVDELEIDENHFTKITAHYRHLDIDIINVVPNEVIFSSIWSSLFIIIIAFIVGLVFLSILVHRSFKRAQDNLAESIRKSNEEEIALKKIEDEIAIAARIQNKMLTSPGVPVRLVPEKGMPVDIMSHIIPAREVGGDLYDYQLKEDTIVVCVGDVSGKGVPASIVMSKCSTLFHAYVTDNPNPDPSALLRYLNRQLCRRNDDLMFVTMWVGVLDLRTGHLEYSSAAHNPPVLARNGSARFMELCQGLPLGMFKDNSYPRQSCDLDSNDSLLLYTDGITEAEGPGHELFGDEKLLQVCASAGSVCPEVLCKSLLNSVARHAGGCSQSDDITLLCFSFGDRFAQLHGISDVQAIHKMVTACGENDLAALVLEEAAVNSFRHGGARFVYIEYNDGIFTMSADGDDFDPTAYRTPDLGDGKLRIGGRGIPLIRQLCSEVTYRRTEYGINIQTFKLK